MMFGTVIGPGTIFLMIVGSVNSAFKIDQLTSFVLNLIPIVLFIVVCLTTKSSTQIVVAELLSILYAIIMMVSPRRRATTASLFLLVFLLPPPPPGRAGGHHPRTERRRPAVAVGHLPDDDGLQFHHSGHRPPARVLVSALRPRLLPDRAVHVPAAHHLLAEQPQQRVLGHARGRRQKEEAHASGPPSLTGFHRSTEFYWVLPGFTGLYWVLLGFTGFYWALLGFTVFLVGSTGFYRFLLGFTSFYCVLLVFTGFNWILLGFT